MKTTVKVSKYYKIVKSAVWLRGFSYLYNIFDADLHLFDFKSCQCRMIIRKRFMA